MFITPLFNKQSRQFIEDIYSKSIYINLPKQGNYRQIMFNIGVLFCWKSLVPSTQKMQTLPKGLFNLSFSRRIARCPLDRIDLSKFIWWSNTVLTKKRDEFRQWTFLFLIRVSCLGHLFAALSNFLMNTQMLLMGRQVFLEKTVPSMVHTCFFMEFIVHHTIHEKARF